MVRASVTGAVDSRYDSEASQTDCLAYKLVFTVFLLEPTFDFDICGIASENMFSVKSFYPTRLVAVLRSGPAQPSPVQYDRGGGDTRFWGLTSVLGSPLSLPKALFFGL